VGGTVGGVTALLLLQPASAATKVIAVSPSYVRLNIFLPSKWICCGYNCDDDLQSLRWSLALEKTSCAWFSI
jgi:hypothetical protein